MQYLLYVSIGVFFGIVMYKSEAASWFRIYEMFQFGSFHMYGIIGSALVLGVLGVQLIKRKNIKPVYGSEMSLQPKNKGVTRYLAGGIIFGLGWALAGVCPGPMYVLAGAGYYSILIVIVGALLGTFVYGLIREKLPH
ncbi:MAG: YeeE/YedE family protein [Flavobacteriales bacterium]|nr:YeeE/YedE family protein [Flavobacteriales bacterium]